MKGYGKMNEYADYIVEQLDKNVSYSEYVSEKVHTNIAYSEYIAEKIDPNWKAKKKRELRKKKLERILK